MHQLQGGWLPSWQTTVVVEPGGTTTVVFAGGFGLPLLMQPQSIADANTSADRIFIFPPVFDGHPKCAYLSGQAGRSAGRVPPWAERQRVCRRGPTERSISFRHGHIPGRD